MNDERATETPRDAASHGALRPVEEHDPLGAALRGLPVERAGAGFTARVLARLDEGAAGGDVRGRSGTFEPRPSLFGPAGWAALAAATLAAVLGLALVRGWAPPSGETIAGSESAPPEAPGAPTPGAAGSAGTMGPVGTPSATSAKSPAAAGTTRDDRAAAAPGGSPPVESDSAHRAGSGAAESGAAGDRISASAVSAGTVPPAAGAPQAAGPRPAAADADAADTRPRTADRGSFAIPPADARAALERVRAELDAVRRDHRRFEVALAELPEIGRDGQPVVFLGGDEGLGLVLDLGREPAAGDDPEAGPRSPSL